jgi:transposase
MRNFNLTQEQLLMLRYEHKIAKKHSAKLAYRINAIILLGTGWTLEEVSNALLLDIETLRSYVQKFEEGGVAKLLENNHHAKRSFLTEEQKQALAIHLEFNLYRTTQEIIYYVKSEFKANYSQSGMTKLLHGLGFTYKMPKLIPSGIDIQAQDEFIECFEKFLRTKNENDIIIFYDSSHPQYQSQNDYGWIRKGKDVLLPNHGMRGRINISGGVDLATGDVIVDFPEKVNSESTVQILKKIEACYPQANTINIILDNAATHHSLHVNDALKDSKINLVFLPPYSPNLNLMERVWGLLRRKLLANSFNETFGEFKKNIKKFFNRTLKDKRDEWVIPLITDEFQSFEGHLIC